jgi:hypothetical protein
MPGGSKRSVPPAWLVVAMALSSPRAWWMALRASVRRMT